MKSIAISNFKNELIPGKLAKTLLFEKDILSPVREEWSANQ